jgi:hypothetical protein
MNPNEWMVPIALLLMLAPIVAQANGSKRTKERDNICEDEDTDEDYEDMLSFSSASSRHLERRLYPVSAP